MGVNGVWLHVVLRQMAPGGRDFPEFGADHERRLESLRRLVRRAARQGIGVYLYLNEPRAMPCDFFRDRPDLAGVREGDATSLCTSQPAVRQWMTNALQHVFREVPDLAGVFTITASENLTNCWSHFQPQGCPRCRGRSEADVITEVIAAIEQGVHSGNPAAHVLAWDWGWNQHGDAAAIIQLDQVAAEFYGPQAVPWVRQAWTAFSQALRQYPYDGRVVYLAPQQMGPANLLYARPTGYAATMVGIPYDDVQSCAVPIPPKPWPANSSKWPTAGNKDWSTCSRRWP